MEVYCQALKCDPTLNAEIANLMANRENVPISRSALLPRVDIHLDAERQRIKLEGLTFANFQSTGIFIPLNEGVTFYNNSVNYYLKLTQPVFNYSNWARVLQSKASVKAAEANFCAVAQNLMVRVVRAYFDVLIADSNLYYTREYKKAVGEQLRQTKVQFEVGTAAITNVLEAQAAYDLAVAQEITDRYNLAVRVETLRTITNNIYCSLQGLSAYLPLITPNPCNIQGWVCTAEKQNYDLLAARYNTCATRENIKVQEGLGLPVLNTYGKYTYNYDSDLQGSGFLTRQKTLEGGIELDWAPIQGGGVIARTCQASFLFQKACKDQEFTHRQVVANTRNAYLGIFAGIAKVSADRSAIRSNVRSVQATIDSYKVGTRTILDVLNQQAQLYNAQKSFAQDRYDYIFQTVLLKQATGTLCVSDLQYINVWLYSRIDISKTDALLEGCICADTLAGPIGGSTPKAPNNVYKMGTVPGATNGPMSSSGSVNNALLKSLPGCGATTTTAPNTTTAPKQVPVVTPRPAAPTPASTGNSLMLPQPTKRYVPPQPPAQPQPPSPPKPTPVVPVY